MKKYFKLSELLIDYRVFNNLSQLDMAISLDLDKKTIQRWENNHSIVGLDKERKLAETTMLPFQLVKNLNGKNNIPTYFDFTTQKYSLSKLAFEVPDADWFIDKFNNNSDRVRKFDFTKDFPPLKKYLLSKNKYNNNFFQLFKKSCELVPGINLIIEDGSEFYSGYSIILPLKLDSYQKLKDQKFNVFDLTVADLVEFSQLDQAIYFEFNITADCNENIFYLSVEILKYFQALDGSEYIFSSIESRSDSKKLYLSLGLDIVWQRVIEENGTQVNYSMYQGNFHSFFDRMN